MSVDHRGLSAAQADILEALLEDGEDAPRAWTCAELSAWVGPEIHATRYSVNALARKGYVQLVGTRPPNGKGGKPPREWRATGLAVE